MKIDLDSFKPYLSSIHYALCRSIVCELQSAHLVGGGIRDYFYKYPIDDVDFILKNKGEESITELINSLAQNNEFDSVNLDVPLTAYRTAKIKVARKGRAAVFDVVLPRKEQYEYPGAKPIVTEGTYLDDIKRRDFSINTLALKGISGDTMELLDPLYGYEDIKNRKLRVLHNQSFQDDPVRVVRGIRFLHRYALTWESRTEALSRDSKVLEAFEKVTMGRRLQELYKVFLEEKVFLVLNDMSNYGMLELILPDIKTPELSDSCYHEYLKKRSLPKSINSLLAYLLHASSENAATKILQLMSIAKKDRKEIISNF